jgi:hypothetical protein
MSENDTFGASSILGNAPATTTLLDGSTVPLPPATPDQPAIGVLRQNAMGELQQLKGDAAFQDLLRRGDPHAIAKVNQLQRIVVSPTGTFYGGIETPQQAEQHQQGWNTFIGARMTDIHGPELGARIEAEMKNNTPITPAEFRQAKAVIAEMKSSEEVQRALKAGNPRVRARWSLAHNMITRPIKTDAA